MIGGQSFVEGKMKTQSHFKFLLTVTDTGIRSFQELVFRCEKDKEVCMK